MATAQGMQLISLLNTHMADFKAACENIDDMMASQAPEGRWTPKEILSHLCGPEGIGFLDGIRRFVEEDTPRIDMVPEQTFMNARRAASSFAALLADMVAEYARIADYLATLSDDQLARKAHIPMLKESPFGEYPTLALWVQAMADYHIAFHRDHLLEIVRELQKNAG